MASVKSLGSQIQGQKRRAEYTVPSVFRSRTEGGEGSLERNVRPSSQWYRSLFLASKAGCKGTLRFCCGCRRMIERTCREPGCKVGGVSCKHNAMSDHHRCGTGVLFLAGGASCEGTLRCCLWCVVVRGGFTLSQHPTAACTTGIYVLAGTAGVKGMLRQMLKDFFRARLVDVAAGAEAASQHVLLRTVCGPQPRSEVVLVRP